MLHCSAHDDVCPNFQKKKTKKKTSLTEKIGCLCYEIIVRCNSHSQDPVTFWNWQAMGVLTLTNKQVKISV